jgi:ribosome-associated protein
MAVVLESPVAQPLVVPTTGVLVADIAAVLDAHKATEINQLCLIGKTAMADHLVIASGTSRRQLETFADKIMEAFPKAVLAVEGRGHSDWVLLDCGGVVVHLFTPNARTFYELERLWG